MKLYDKYENVYYSITNSKRTTKKVYKCDYILAFDSETYRGSCRLLCRNSKTNNYIYKPSFYQCLQFLWYKANIPNGYRFFYNLDFDITAILKKFDNIKKVFWLKDGIEVKYKEFSMKWLKGKYFMLKKGKRSIFFTDLWNFFKAGLDKSVVEYLKVEGKDDIDAEKLNNSLWYWNKNLENIINYCIKDCYLTKQLAQFLIDNILKAKVQLPKLLVSNGSLAKADFRYHCKIQNLKQQPQKIIQISYDCYFGGKFELQKRGTFKKLILADIVSQYPSFMKDLPNLNKGVWQTIDYLPENQCLGYFKVDLDIPKDIEFSTVPFKLKNSTILTCCGIIKNRWLTWYDLDLMRDYITKIHEAYQFVKLFNDDMINDDNVDFYYPYRRRILHHFKMKSYHKHESGIKILAEIHKLTINAEYGTNIERHCTIDKKGNKFYSVGILFNPIYASQITAFGRWSVLKPFPRIEWKYIDGIHTDSILMERDLTKYLDIGNQLGQWSIEAKGKGLILNTGMYQVDSLIKTRGVGKKHIGKPCLNQNVLYDYNNCKFHEKCKYDKQCEKKELKNDWFDFCKCYLKEKRKEIRYSHMRKLSEGLVRDKSLVRVNTMTSETKSIDINADMKRCWNSKFLNFKDFLSRKISSRLYYVRMNDSETDITENNLYHNPLNNDIEAYL